MQEETAVGKAKPVGRRKRSEKGMQRVKRRSRKVGGGKVVIEKGNGGEGKSKISHSCSIFPAV